MFTQMSAKEGIKQFDEKTIAAMVKELKQLNNGAMRGKPVVVPVPIDPSKLTKFEKRAALDAVNLIKKETVILRVEHALIVQNNVDA